MGHFKRLWQTNQIRLHQIWSRAGRKITSCAGVVAIVLLPYLTLRLSPTAQHQAHAATESMGKPNELILFILYSAAGIPPWDPFYQEAVDPPPTSPTTSFIPLLLRQANCSLTRQVFDTSFNLQPHFIYPNYQDFLHQGSGLSTTPDKWANGCAQPTTGIASQQIETVQTQSNGSIVMAVVNISGNFPAANGQNLVIATIGATTAQPISQVTYPLVSTAYITASLAVADVNGDGINDILVASLPADTSTSGEVSVLLGNNDGTFQAAKNTPTNVAATNVTADDMNGDGKLDLVLTGVTAPGIAVLPGKGDGTFGSEIDGPAGAGGLRAITADLNGDGKKDVASSSGQILLGNGDGTLTLLPGTLPTVGPSVGGGPQAGQGIAVADFNKDGKLDLALTNNIGVTVDLYLGHGDGTFVYQSSFASLYGLQNISTTDIDGDGNPDLFIGSTSGGTFSTDANLGGLFESALGAGDGTFFSGGDAYLPNTSALDFKTVDDVADFNGDGKPDIVSIDVNAANTTPQLRVRQGLATGKFTDLATTPINVSGLTGGQSNTGYLAAADFNGDSKQDVVFTTTPLGSGASTISATLGNGDGTFATQSDYASPGVVVGLAVADLNGDGKPDIVFLSDPSNAGPADLTQTTIEAMLNKGDGTFQAAQAITPQANLEQLAVADVNGDGKQDLVVTTGNAFTSSVGNVLVYLGNGDGTFQKPSSLSVGTYPGALTIADMNSDGHPDIIAATTDSNSNPFIDILLGKGDGTFQTATSAALPQGGVSSLAVADLNGDKKPDIVLTACCGLANTMAALGNGDGTIAEAGILGTGVSSTFIKINDFNGDGIPDLLLTSNSYAIDVFLSSPSTVSATYPTSTSLTTSATATALGQPVTFTVQITSPEGNAPPAGSVNFLDGTTVLATQTLSAGGSATYTTSSLSAGAHSITATYAGNSTFATSTSSPVTVTVSAVALAKTTTTLTATPAAVASGGSVSMSAVVAGASGSTGTPTGAVTFSDGTTKLGTGALNSAGAATYSTSSLAVGEHSITAAYGGDTNFAASTSSAVTVTVTAAVPGFSLSLSPATATVNAGSTATTTMTITPSGGFNSQVSFACSGLPAASTCAFSPATVTPSGSAAATTTLTVATNVATASVREADPAKRIHAGEGATFLALVFLGLGGLMRQQRKWNSFRWSTLLAVLLIAGIMTAMVACGGGGNSSSGGGTTTPAGTNDVTVTATAGSLSKTASFTLTVQ